MEPIRLGTVPPGLGTPDRFVTLEDEQGPRLRIDLYRSADEACCFEELQLWSRLIVLGCGERLWLIDPERRNTTVIPLGSYFGSLYPGDDYLLVASADRLIHVQPDSSLRWTSDPLGIDGIIVHQVTHGIIHGSGEWDPPGGWKPFRLSLDTGQPVGPPHAGCP
jgi:hypothetical protein